MSPIVNPELLFQLAEDRYLNAMPPSAVSPSPVDGAAEPANPAASAAEQDTVSIPEGSNKTHTFTLHLEQNVNIFDCMLIENNPVLRGNKSIMEALKSAS